MFICLIKSDKKNKIQAGPAKSGKQTLVKVFFFIYILIFGVTPITFKHTGSDYVTSIESSTCFAWYNFVSWLQSVDFYLQ